MSLIKRYIDIDFGVDARPLKRVPGTIVQGNNKVNVLRITYPNISSDHVVVALTQRADQVTGSTFLDYSANSGSFELVLHNWFTAVSGELQITFAIYSQTPEINEEGIITTETDTLRKVYLNVEESISADLPAPEDESIFLDVAVMVKSFDDRITALEPQFITDLSALDNFTNPGIYKFNLNNQGVFHLYVSEYTSNGVKYIRQIRSSATGYYARTNIDSVWNEWEDKKQYNINGITEWNENVSYKKGAIVSYSNNLFVCRIPNKNIIPYTDEAYWNHITFDSYVVREDLNNYVPKEEGKGLSTNDLTNALLAKLNALKNYDDTAINNKITAIERILVSDNVDLDTLQEIVDVLEENEGDINAIFTAIAKKVDKDGLKTINGESIVCSGNIEIKGDSSGDSGVVELDLTADNTMRELIDALISKGYQLSEVGDIVRLKLKTSDFDFGTTYIENTTFGGGSVEEYTLTAIKFINDEGLKVFNGGILPATTLGDIYTKYENIYTSTQVDRKIAESTGTKVSISGYGQTVTFQEILDELIELGYTDLERYDNSSIHVELSIYPFFNFTDIYIIRESSTRYKVAAYQSFKDGLKTLEKTITDTSITMQEIWNSFKPVATEEYVDNAVENAVSSDIITINADLYPNNTLQDIIDACISQGYDLTRPGNGYHFNFKFPAVSFNDVYLIYSGSGYRWRSFRYFKEGAKYLNTTFSDTSITISRIDVMYKPIATTEDIENATSDYLKNNDARPNEYFDVAYECITFRGSGDSDGTSAIGVDTYGVQAYATGEGYSYFYLGADGSVQIIGDKELLINNKSFDKLYEDVQLLKGSYDLLRPSNGMAYTYEVDSNMAKYAMISQVGGMSYKSNNLLVLDDVSSTTLNGITYSVKEGIIKLSGTSTSSVFITLPIKSINLNGSYARNGFNNFAVATYDDIYLRFRNGIAGAFENNFLYFNSQNKTGTMTYDNATFDQLAINIKSGITCNNYAIKPMLVSSSTAPTTWELGFEGIRHTKVTNIIHRSSNLIQLDDVSSTTKNGITYKVKDGVITLNGTTTSAFGINLPLVNTIPAGTYTLNRFGDKGTDGSTFGICYSNGWEMGVQIAFNNDTTYKTATITNEGTYLRLYLNSNKTYSNYTLKPMLVRGSTVPADFSSYAEYANISLNNLHSMEGNGLGINNSVYSYFDFDKDVLIRTVKEIDLSTLNWSITQGGTEHERFKAKFADIRLDGVINSQMVVSGEYVRTDSSGVYNHTIDKSLAIEAANYFAVYDSRYINNLTGFKEYLKNNPTKIVYELIESTEVAIPEINTFFDASKGGVIIFENEHQQAVPYEIKYIRPED